MLSAVDLSPVQLFASALERRDFREGWFCDADVFEMESCSVSAVGDRVQAHYRIRLRENFANSQIANLRR